MKSFGLGKKYVDGYVLLIDGIYGGVITEGSKVNLFRYNVTGFNEEEEKFNLKCSAQAI